MLLRARGALIAVTVALHGCSIVAVRGPSRHAATAAPDCTRSRVLPTLDVVAAIATVALAHAAADFDGFDCNNDCSDVYDGGTLAGGIILAVPLALSAGVGFVRVDRCRTATAQWSERARPGS